jgi:hypothetical protein
MDADPKPQLPSLRAGLRNSKGGNQMIPRWFDAFFHEAEEAGTPVDFARLGEQFALRIEEVLPPQETDNWWSLVEEWKEHIGKRDTTAGMDTKVLDYLKRHCLECMDRIPENKEGEFFVGMSEKIQD